MTAPGLENHSAFSQQTRTHQINFTCEGEGDFATGMASVVLQKKWVMLNLSTFRKPRKERPMTRKQDSAKRLNWKALMAEQEDFLRPLIQEVVQQVLEAEMDEALGAEKGERTVNRLGYRSGHYGRTLVTRVSWRIPSSMK